MNQKLIATTLFLFTLAGLYAQPQDDSFTDTLMKNGYVVFATINKDRPIPATSANKIDILRKVVKGDMTISFEKVWTVTIDSEIVQDKFQLYKDGIKMNGGEYVIHSTLTDITFFGGSMAEFEKEAFVNKSLADKERFSIIAQRHFTDLHRDQNKSAQSIIKSAEEIYYLDSRSNKYRPAYQVHIESSNTLSKELVYVSAKDGEYLGAASLLCSVNFTGTAQTQYSGNQNIVTDAPTVAGPFRLQEVRNGVNIRTRNVNRQTNYSNVTEFTDNDNTWTAAEHVGNRAAFDAHWGAEVVFDYWRTVHSRNSINGSGMAIESYVHWDSGSPNQFNAQWDGTNNAMRYDDGLGLTNPLTSLDICAHEFGHGIDQYTGNLAYEKESGALDEGFADIWGAVIEAWAAPAKQRWMMGEDVLLGPIRNLANPGLFGSPDTYLGANWVATTGCTPSILNDWCGVHTNSSVLAYWFFLLSEGGNGVNDNGNNFVVSGIGITDAARIAYRTKQLIGISSADYFLARSVSITAAQTLFGANSCQVVAVTNAWYAVGVGFAFSGVPAPVISGPGKFCSGSANYNIPAGTITWTPIIPTGVATWSAPGMGNTLTLTKGAGHGFVTLNASVANACGTSSTGVATLSNIAVGFPSFTDTIVGTKTSTPNGIHNYTFVLPSRYPSVSYNWSVPAGWTIMTGQGTNTVKVKVNSTSGSLNLNVTACGLQRGIFAYINVGTGGGDPDFTDPAEESMLRASPNPATNTTTISLLSNNKLQATSQSTIQEIKITDKVGNIKRQLKFKTGQSTQTVDVSGLPSDVYTVSVFDGVKWRSTKVIVQ